LSRYVRRHQLRPVGEEYDGAVAGGREQVREQRPAGLLVEVLRRLVQTVVCPELWEVRNELTAPSTAESA
jgi:hypothetical protein